MTGRSWKLMAGAAALSACLSGAALGDEGNIPTVASFKEAQEMAAARHIPILVDFSAEW